MCDIHVRRGPDAEKSRRIKRGLDALATAARMTHRSAEADLSWIGEPSTPLAAVSAIMSSVRCSSSGKSQGTLRCV